MIKAYEKFNRINSLAVLIGSIPVTRKALGSMGIRKGSLIEKLILVGTVVIVGKIIAIASEKA